MCKKNCFSSYFDASKLWLCFNYLLFLALILFLITINNITRYVKKRNLLAINYDKEDRVKKSVYKGVVGNIEEKIKRGKSEKIEVWELEK